MNQVQTLSRPFDGLQRIARRLRDRAQVFVLAYPREAIGLGVLGFVAAVALGSMAVPNPATNPAAHAAPPPPPPMTYQQVAPDQAVKVNASIPLAGGPNPAATPFVFRGNPSARTEALQCLASAV